MINKNTDFPFQVKISFKKVIDAYRERIKTEEKPITKDYLEKMLAYIEDYPQLESGIDNVEDLNKHNKTIEILLDDLFPNVLTNNEIKAASTPRNNFIFNSSKRFDEILEKAGKDYKFSVRNLSPDLDYVYGCILILNQYFGHEVDFTRPFYIDIPDENGIMHHYRLAVNADFVSFEPTDKAIELSDKDIDKLIQNTDDIELWREKFPPQSWIFKGFVILNLTDVTVDDGISDLKTQLINNRIPDEENIQSLVNIFRSIYKIPDLRVGFTMFDKSETTFYKMEKGKVKSFILNNEKECDCEEVLCKNAFKSLLKNHKYFTIANVEDYALKTNHNLLSETLLTNEVKSCILAPMAKNDELLGVLELVSYRKNELNNINAVKLEDILPYITTAVERNTAEFENRVKAVIQSECTSIHPSVLWVFEEEAKRYIKDLDNDGVSSFRDIAFKDIYPLYGQIDIVGSSDERNKAIQKDLLQQLGMITKIIDDAMEIEELPIYEQVKFRVNEFSENLKDNLNASSEQRIINFIFKEIKPMMQHLKKQSRKLRRKIDKYSECMDPSSGVIYSERKNYDDTVQRINRTLSRFIDRKQIDAQKIFPHYFERYKTDGVDHNIYIGEEMTKNRTFSKVYLYNLRLWQLQIMCEMENKFYHIQKDMPLKLDAASLILVFNSTLSIRYRMDEKKFDVDGTYNARYEIIKKRIDKAYVKGTEERITQKGKIAIIYSQKSDQREYLRYIKYLQSKNYIGENVELLELEDVQGVVGLKAIRVEVLYHKEDTDDKETFTYEALMEELH
ncbi:GAF domain-containing protein [Mesonia aquimarina]|uniref:GAF domain-containing protein n=1 Tax=Mesonia aquimarina TaxID=1504967 RepID=UPI000EF56BE8|nr:GAF domain-containing protein [Mesonia aquimarina]